MLSPLKQLPLELKRFQSHEAAVLKDQEACSNLIRQIVAKLHLKNNQVAYEMGITPAYFRMLTSTGMSKKPWSCDLIEKFLGAVGEITKL